MTPVAAPPLFAFDNTLVRDLDGLFVPWQGDEAPDPRVVVLNERLAVELGVDPDALRQPDAVRALTGSLAPAGAEPVALAYAGHQFGGYSPRLGDGRALLLGEVVTADGRRVDIHLKGSGRTPFARGGDGKAVLGPMLREYVVSEAMAALGIPTTRALAVVATGERVAREEMLPGAVLARVAASHLRVGTFQYAASMAHRDVLRRLADHAIARHHPGAAEADDPAFALFERVVDAQADLVARWMLVGFVHGVLNTDNLTISGETIDYGPCAFMDAYDPATVFSSIDHGGRYAYGNQPGIVQWGLARLAEAVLPLMVPDEPEQADIDAAVATLTAVLDRYPTRYEAAHAEGMRAKLGLPAADAALVTDMLALLHEQGIDWTSWFRALAADLRGERDAARGLAVDIAAADAWLDRWRAAVPEGDRAATAAAMDAVNPLYIPRNHLVEEALAAATAGDEAPLHRLLDVLADPFTERPGLDRYAAPGPTGGPRYRTFCGT
ncbi:MAG TPA: YdiU family protein [Iamia sp.]|nr:YdiU family protein [Iamia sp.]